MQFQSYVPNAVQVYIKEEIEGIQTDEDSSLVPGLHAIWVASRQGLESRLSATRREQAKLDSLILAASRDSQQGRLVELEEHREIVILSLESLEARFDTLRRLAADERMRPAFSHLIRDFTSDTQWRVFFAAALNAREDFASDRAALKSAQVLKMKISKAAEQLALLLSEFNELGMIDGPEEFSHPPELFHRGSFEILQDLEQRRLKLLAEYGITEIDLRAGASPAKEYTAGHANEPRGSILNAIWESSQYFKAQDDQRPSTVAIINDIAIAAQNYTPQLYGVSAAATRSKKNNRKTQYIRAFWHLISDYPLRLELIKRTPNLMHAMAITATVVLNGQDDDVSYDDVRKALEDRSKAVRKNVPGRRKMRLAGKR